MKIGGLVMHKRLVDAVVKAAQIDHFENFHHLARLQSLQRIE